jgi:DNA-binding response OmpR family regulator
MRILLVESNQPLICLIAEIIRHDLSADVCRAQTGAWALQMLATMQFDFAFVSVMPDGSGFDVARHAAEKGIAVLLTSGHPLVIDKLQMLGFPHLAKPYRISDLMLRAIQIMRYPNQNTNAVKASSKMELRMRMSSYNSINKTQSSQIRNGHGRS